jgi:hypothetical protein
MSFEIKRQPEMRWVKPFSSGLSCLDTVDGECLRELDADECEEYCRQHPFCDAGYHVKFSNQQYCIPLNGLTTFGRREAFNRSTFPASQSVFFHPDIGVAIHTFQNIKNVASSSFPAYIEDPFINPTVIQHTKTNKFLSFHLSLTTNRLQAVAWQIFRFIYDFSGVNSGEYDRISNGEIVSFRLMNDMTLVFNDNSYDLVPVSALMGYSSTFDYSDVYYFQIFQSSNVHDKIRPEEPFAIRINKLPIRRDKDDPVFFMTVSEDGGHLTATEIHDTTELPSIIQEFRIWRFIPSDKNISSSSYSDDAFIKSQWYYARDYFGATLAESSDKKNRGVYLLIASICLLVIIIIFAKYLI